MISDEMYKEGHIIATLEAQLAEVTAERDRHDLWLSNARTESERLAAILASVSVERDSLRTALRQVSEAADKARIFLKNLTMRTGVDTRVGRDGYKEYERLRDALALPVVQAVLGRSLERKG